MNISFEIENITPKEMDDLTVTLFDYITNVEDYTITDYEITE